MCGLYSGFARGGESCHHVISGVIPPGAKKTSVCSHSDGRPVHVTLVFSCPEMSPLRVCHRSGLPRHRDLTCALTELEPTVYAKPFPVWLWPQQFCTSMSSVPDLVSRHLNVLWREAPPHSALELVGSLVPDAMQHGQDSWGWPWNCGLWHPGHWASRCALIPWLNTFIHHQSQWSLVVHHLTGFPLSCTSDFVIPLDHL